MNRTLSLAATVLALLVAPSSGAQSPGTQPSAALDPAPSLTVPREKVSLICADSYFKTVRTDFLLQDEAYPHCSLKLPLALRERWRGERTFYLIPRLAATLYARDSRGGGRWLPLAPLVNPGDDPLHRVIRSRDYKQVELTAAFGKLATIAGERTPDTVGAGGKLTVCVSPVKAGEAPCVTYDVTARFKVYKR